MKKVLIILIAIMIFSGGMFLGGFIFRIIHFNGYAELTDKWQKTCDDIQNRCDEQTEELREQIDALLIF